MAKYLWGSLRFGYIYSVHKSKLTRHFLMTTPQPCIPTTDGVRVQQLDILLTLTLKFLGEIFSSMRLINDILFNFC